MYTLWHHIIYMRPYCTNHALSVLFNKHNYMFLPENLINCSIVLNNKRTEQKMKETHTRSFLKALSWRIFATLTTIVISYLIIGKISFAIYIGLFEFVSKIGLFYMHERIWNSINFGMFNSKDRAPAS